MTRSGRRMRSRVRWGGALTAAVALTALAVIGPPGVASASSTDNYNQMTGVGTTASAITVNWTQGLLNAENQPIAAAGTELAPNSGRLAGTGPLSFMYSDFKSLQVTVSQTQNIGHQGITIKWTGGKQTDLQITPQDNFLQMMECYGDSDTGPSPEDCEYGSTGLLPQQAVTNPGIGGRTGELCPAGSVPNPPLGLRSQDGTSSVQGCDTFEPTSESPSHCDQPGCEDNTLYSIPFVPVDDPTHPLYSTSTTDPLTKSFDRFSTNEVQIAVSKSNGSGQQQFETLTGTQAPGLGCGQVETNGKPRDCWLVIVPRGTFEPNGYQVNPDIATQLAGFINTSPLAASNWAQRIQIHLSYAPLGDFCPIGVVPRGTIGTQVVTRAVESWQLALNESASCKRIYSFTATLESDNTGELTTPGSGTGLAFTTIPIGSETTRYGGHPPGLPKILYAPVAVTALGMGFNINEAGNGNDTTPVELTPRLLAKAMTQVYRLDLPDYDTSLSTKFPGPKWSLNNPVNITEDPAFTKLNGASVRPYTQAAIPLAPLLTEDHSALNQQVWRWVQSDPATSAWLDGKADASDPVTSDPDYVRLHPGKAPALDSFPRAYAGVLDLGTCGPPECSPKKEEDLHTLDLLPYADNYDAGASTVLAANDSSELASSWADINIAPDGTNGWWAKTGVQPLGQIFMWAVADTPDLAAYGLVDAQLCKPSGTTGCVQPSIDSVTKALDSASMDKQGLLEVNPAKVPAGAYPLVDVVYAAVLVNQSKAALNDYADLINFAAGQGQTTGSAPGDLPPGYLPLPANLQAQAKSVVKQLRALANPPTHSPTPSHTPTTHSPSQSPTTTTSPTTTPTSSTPGPTAGASATPSSTPVGAAYPSGSPSAQGPVTLPPSAELLGGTTPRQPVGTIRWALIAVLIIGAAGALGGTLLRSARMPRWRQRERGMRPR